MTPKSWHDANRKALGLPPDWGGGRSAPVWGRLVYDDTLHFACHPLRGAHHHPEDDPHAEMKRHIADLRIELDGLRAKQRRRRIHIVNYDADGNPVTPEEAIRRLIDQ